MVTSVNVPSPLLRNKRTPPYWVTRTSGQAVVVDVADGHAHAVAGDVEAGALADVGEGAVRSLVEEPVGGPEFGPPLWRR